MKRAVLLTLLVAGALHGCARLTSSPLLGFTGGRTAPEADARLQAIQRAQIWLPGQVSARNIVAGPQRKDGFTSRQTITCKFDPKDLSGASPKFACLRGDEELKVKYGGGNAEVYAEVAATRLLWALGFGADVMYPVRVLCDGCPESLRGLPREGGHIEFDPATIERKLDAREFPEDDTWSWRELDAVREDLGGAPRAHRDALKLLAVFLQHTDTKPQQQRLVCLDAAPKDGAEDAAPCAKPFMMINDLGLTFGRANTFNVNAMGMNLVQWAATPVWRQDGACVGNLPKSFTGTLENPVISEEGRAFLAGLMTQLTDKQIADLFEVSRVTLRLREPDKARSGFATIGEWVDAFKQKRDQIVSRRCA
jgi:hypothetical protein